MVALDFGMKWNILRHLVEIGCRVTVMPGSATAERDSRAASPTASSFPTARAIPAARAKPRPCEDADSHGRASRAGFRSSASAWGISFWARPSARRRSSSSSGIAAPIIPCGTYATGKIEITTQNHGFAVDPSTLPGDVEVTHINLNDQTLEGMRHKHLPIFSVQYHPEASAGPHDSQYLFKEFRHMLPAQHRGTRELAQRA